MSPRSKREYLEALFLRYKNTDRAGKSLILDEFCSTCGHHRKHAIRLLRGFKRFTAPNPASAANSLSTTAQALVEPLEENIHCEPNLPCSKRLKAILPCGCQAIRPSSVPSKPIPTRHYCVSPRPPSTACSSRPASVTPAADVCTTSPGSLLRNQSPSVPTVRRSKPARSSWRPIPGPLRRLLSGQFIYNLDCLDIAHRLE